MRPFVVLISWGLLSTASVLVAELPRQRQSAPPQTPPVFRAGVDVIQLDLSVFDKNRQPIRGLTAADFTVLEDNQPREIVALSEKTVAAPSTSGAAWTREVGPDVTNNTLPDGRLLVILMDDATILFEPGMIQRAKRFAMQVIDRLGPNDLAAVLFPRESQHSQDFTNDRGKLRAAVQRFSAGFFLSEPDEWNAMRDSGNWSCFTGRALGNTISYLADVPQRRKAIIYISVGVPPSCGGDYGQARSRPRQTWVHSDRPA